MRCEKLHVVAQPLHSSADEDAASSAYSSLRLVLAGELVMSLGGERIVADVLRRKQPVP